MSQAVESLLTYYESGRLSRRELVGLLAALAAAPRVGTAQPAAALRAATLNHASLIVSDLDRSVAFYQRVFGLPVKSTQQGGVNLAVGDAFLGVYQGGAGRDAAHQSRLLRPARFRSRGDGRRARGAGLACRIADSRRRDAGLHGRSRQSARSAPGRQLLRRARRARQRVPRLAAPTRNESHGSRPDGHQAHGPAGHAPHRQLRRCDEARRRREQERGCALVLLSCRLPRDRRRRGRDGALDARDRSELARRRSRSEQSHALSAERHSGNPGAHVDPAQRHGQGPHESRARVQSRRRRERSDAGARSRSSDHDDAVLVPDPHGRRHLDVQSGQGARRQGPEAARRDGARHRAALQPPLRRDVRAARRRHRRQHRDAAGPRWPQDVEELRQRDPAVRRRETAAQADHEDQDELARAGATEGSERQRAVRRLSRVRDRSGSLRPCARATRKASAGAT